MKKKGIETHVVVSESAKTVMKYESDNFEESMKRIESSSDKIYAENDIAASIASGSFKVDGMIVAPCSMKTLSAIANGYSDNLVSRAADVQLKQQRKLVLVPRESPLNAIHLENMLKLSRIGVWIIPPMLCYYTKPKSVEDMTDNVVGRVLDAFEVEHNLYKRWEK